MQLIVNGEARDVPGIATLADLLHALALDSARVAVEVNLQVVPRARHATHPLREGDRIEIVSFVGGG